MSFHNKIILFIVFITLFNSGCLSSDEEFNENLNIMNIKYILEIQTNKTFNFTLYVPAYQDSFGNYLSINKDIEVRTGNVTIITINSSHGVALILLSNESFSLELNKTYNYNTNVTNNGILNYWDLSMYSRNDGYWVYFDNGNDTSNRINILFDDELRYRYRYHGGRYNSEFNISLNRGGWTLIPAYRDGTLVDYEK